MLKKIMSSVAMVIGLAIIIIGVNTYYCGTNGYTLTYSPEYVENQNLHKIDYDVRSASFGADFYSYIYDASDTIVSELNDSLDAYNGINKSIVQLTNRVEDGNRFISLQLGCLDSGLERMCGLIIIALGLATFAYSLFSIAVAFEPSPNATAKKEEISENPVPDDENTPYDNSENEHEADNKNVEESEQQSTEV